MSKQRRTRVSSSPAPAPLMSGERTFQRALDLVRAADAADAAGDKAGARKIGEEVKAIFASLNPGQQKLFDAMCQELDAEYAMHRELREDDDDEEDGDEQEFEDSEDDDVDQDPPPVAAKPENKSRATPTHQRRASPAGLGGQVEHDIAEFPGGIMAIVVDNEPIIMVDTAKAPSGLVRRLSHFLDFLY